MKLAASNPHGNEYAQSLGRRSRNAVPGICKCCVFGKSQSYLTTGLRHFQIVLRSNLFLLAKWLTTNRVVFFQLCFQCTESMGVLMAVVHELCMGRSAKSLVMYQ